MMGNTYDVKWRGGRGLCVYVCVCVCVCVCVHVCARVCVYTMLLKAPLTGTEWKSFTWLLSLVPEAFVFKFMPLPDLHI